MKTSLCLVTSLVCLTFFGISHGAVFNVTPAPDSDCTDFTCDLQSALNAAGFNQEDDTIFLAPGKYSSSTPCLGFAFCYLSSNDNSLTLIGSGADKTVLDGGGLLPVMQLETPAFLGNQNGDSNNDFTVQGITFQNGNTSAPGGGGLFVGTLDADIIVKDCAFYLNKATGSANSTNDGGGGLDAVAQNFGSVFLSNNFFLDNSVADSNGGGSFTVSVAGLVVLEGNTYLNNITGGSASNHFGGGALTVSVYGDLIANRNLFLGNNANNGAGGYMAIQIFGTGLITNNVIARNTSLASAATSSSGGGGLYVVNAPTASTALTNNTIVENVSLDGDGGGLFTVLAPETTEMTVSNNIIRGNTASGGALCTTSSCNDIVVYDAGTNNIGGSFTISHSDFSDIVFQCKSPGCTPHQNVDAATNLNLDPLFVAPFQNDFHLSNASPLIDKGDANAPGLPPLDFDGESRIQGPAPDMGAFESAPVPLPLSENCANNVDDDGDGDIDCLDADCAGAAACLGSNQSGSENCANNLDDDGDGATDCADSNCVGAIACQPTSLGGENCANNVDDDGDGDIDCLDSSCSGAAACAGAEPPPSNAGGGCHLAGGGEALGSSSMLLLLAPLLLGVKRKIRK